MAKGASISGFPEWLPSERVVEQRVIDTLREVFELNGFIGIETRAVEQGSSLLKKGETSKEIYLLSRLQEVGHESDTPIEDRLGLHFDLTVPLSRYVVEHSGDLAFPFKRWQIQKVWRGERPQEGRFREFVQADIDVIGNGDLPDHYAVELPLVMVSALERLREFGLPKATVHANNRKLSEGFYRGLGLTDVEGVLREIDKLDKIGADEVAKLLVEGCGADENQARACLELAELTAADGAELSGKFDTLCEKHGIANDSEAYVLARQGLDTLAMIVDEAARIRPGSVIADLKIARAHANRVSPASVLVAVWNEEDRSASNQIANQLRARGIAADVAPTAAKLGKQIKYADKLGIPYVWFPADKSAQDASDEVKNIITGDQQPANAQSWEPDTVYAQQTVTVEA